MRAGLVAGDGIDPRLVPPTSIEANLRASGVSARQLASSANGQVLLTQGPGKTKSGFLGMFGGGIFAQLASKLNPFSAQDPYTQLDCTVARVDIVDGRATVEPVLMQSKKVTVTADGKVDLHTEDLTVDFNTRPREGIGVSPGHVYQPLHQARRDTREPEDRNRRQGRGVRRRRRRNRRRVGGRERTRGPRPRRGGRVQEDARRGNTPSDPGG